MASEEELCNCKNHTDMGWKKKEAILVKRDSLDHSLHQSVFFFFQPKTILDGYPIFFHLLTHQIVVIQFWKTIVTLRTCWSWISKIRFNCSALDCWRNNCLPFIVWIMTKISIDTLFISIISKITEWSSDSIIMK